MNAVTTLTAKFEALGKEGLRAACREAGISYGKLNNDGMRAALVAHYNKDEPVAEAAVEVTSANPFGGLLGGTAPRTTSATGTRVVDGKRVDSAARTQRDPSPIVPRATRKGYTIQKDREERNGVKRPSEGTTCGAVWSVFDNMHGSENGLKAADLPAIADEHGWNRTNVSCEYYAWRKFMGIKGRAAK